jgi:hypothetical protein
MTSVIIVCPAKALENDKRKTNKKNKKGTISFFIFQPLINKVL